MLRGCKLITSSLPGCSRKEHFLSENSITIYNPVSTTTSPNCYQQLRKSASNRHAIEEGLRCTQSAAIQIRGQGWVSSTLLKLKPSPWNNSVIAAQSDCCSRKKSRPLKLLLLRSISVALGRESLHRATKESNSAPDGTAIVQGRKRGSFWTSKMRCSDFSVSWVNRRRLYKAWWSSGVYSRGMLARGLKSQPACTGFRF